MAARGASGLDVYDGWARSRLMDLLWLMHWLPRVTALFARPWRFSAWARVISALAGIAMLLALVGNLYPVPEGPTENSRTSILAYLTLGMLCF